jgi:hypothetical protein
VASPRSLEIDRLFGRLSTSLSRWLVSRELRD